MGYYENNEDRWPWTTGEKINAVIVGFISVGSIAVIVVALAMVILY